LGYNGYMKSKRYTLLPLLFILLFSMKLLHASEDSNNTKSEAWHFLPFVFSSDSTGFAAGASVMKDGLFQSQTSFIATVFSGLPKDVEINGEKDEATFSGGFIALSDYRLPFTDRLYFSFTGLKSSFPEKPYYIDGSHNSKKSDAFISSGDSDFFTTTFEYVLPIGEAAADPSRIFTLIDGFCVGREGCGDGVPFISGRTSIGIKTFWQTDKTDNTDLWEDTIWWQDDGSKPSWNTNGLRFFLTHDNTDFETNPSRGYHFQFQYSKDFGWGDSLQSWDFLEFQYNHYIDLDTFSFTQQNVLAFSMWTGYSFSWDNYNDISPGFAAHRPPMWEGARLGGFNRMRGYDMDRFSDKAVFYATVEYRAIIEYNPLKDSDFLPVDVEWFQVVPFVEAGRVHDQYNHELLNDMKYDVGVSLRTMISDSILRLDVAHGEEGTYIWLMESHPFDF